MQKDFPNCKRWLRKNFPTKRKLFIKLVSMETIVKWSKFDGEPYKEGDHWHGYCRSEEDELGRKQFTIYVNKADSEKKQIDSLLHEYAHVLQFEQKYVVGPVHGYQFKKYYDKFVEKWGECT